MHESTRARSRAAAITALLAVSTSVMARAADLQTRHEFKIPAQALDTALLAFSDQAKVQVLMWAGTQSDARSPGAMGEKLAVNALTSILDSTGFSFRTVDAETVAIVKDGASATAASDWHSADTRSGKLRLAQADTGPADTSSEIEALATVKVSGTRIVRDGYEAPTPVTVVGAEQLQDSAKTNIADALENLPAFQGSDRLANGSAVISSFVAGVNAFNLRGMGSNRTLVLFDGRRFPPAFTNGVVDTALFPDALVSRVEVVTGGASAAYGSDAVAGVVNYILDTNFTGIKGSLNGGVTNSGDRKTDKLSLAAGFKFADNRGHVLLNIDASHSDQLRGYERSWNTIGYVRIPNNGYTAANGQPQLISRRSVGLADTYGGGIITAGPMKGIAFGAGGQPFQWNYGDPALLSSTYQVGGDWEEGNMQAVGSLSPEQTNKHLFSHVSFDITDNVQVFGEYLLAEDDVFSICCYQYYHGNLVVHPDNPFMPASVAAQAVSLGLTNIPFGKTVRDLPAFGAQIDRMSRVYVAGAKGNFDVSGKNWKWNLYAERGQSDVVANAPQSNVDRFAMAIDAVRAPSGEIVCRSTLTDPTNGCVPYNLFGTPIADRPVGVPGVNTQAALDYITGGGDPHVHQTLTRDTVSFDVSGEPFSSWAGPVSLAAGAEWRKDDVLSEPDALSITRKHYSTNFGLPFAASNHVTEGFLEALVPLADRKPWAESLDFNGAVRLTDYSTSGTVITWKAGLTYNPINDVRFRVTQSRDIRAPNLTELFATPSTGRTAYRDPFLGNESFPLFTITVGNPDLQPEKADTTGFGVVYQPSWLSGFSTSVDYYRINLKGAIASIAAQSILDLCFAGDQNTCSFISRMPNGQLDSIVLKPVNQNSQLVSGIDIEASYRTRLSNIVDSWGGDVALRLLATNTLENSTNTGLLDIDRAGDNGNGIPRWSLTASATYSNGRVRATWTERAISAGHVDNTYLQCMSNCPTDIPKGFTTIDDNHVPSYFTGDFSLAYQLYPEGTHDAEVYLAINNVFDRVPPLITQTGNAYGPHTNANLYDVLGREYYLGMRFRL